MQEPEESIRRTTHLQQFERCNRGYNRYYPLVTRRPILLHNAKGGENLPFSASSNGVLRLGIGFLMHIVQMCTKHLATPKIVSLRLTPRVAIPRAKWILDCTSKVHTTHSTHKPTRQHRCWSCRLQCQSRCDRDFVSVTLNFVHLSKRNSLDVSASYTMPIIGVRKCARTSKTLPCM